MAVFPEKVESSNVKDESPLILKTPICEAKLLLNDEPMSLTIELSLTSRTPALYAWMLAKLFLYNEMRHSYEAESTPPSYALRSISSHYFIHGSLH